MPRDAELQVNNNYQFLPFEAFALSLVGDSRIDPHMIFSSYKSAEEFGEKNGYLANGYRVISIYIQNSGSFY